MRTPSPSSLVACSFLAVAAFAAGCSGGVSPSTNPSPMPSGQTGSRTAAAPPPPLVQAAWRTSRREDLDLWLHSYAMIADDTTLVPYFRRGYRDRMVSLRQQRGVSTLLDANRSQLRSRIASTPELATSGQFVPLYFQSWDQLRQAIDVFVRNNGNVGSVSDPAARTALAVLGSAFRTASDREWLRVFAQSVEDERVKFYHEYWLANDRTHAAVATHADSLWQRSWRPALQRFLNNTQQANGELYLSGPIGGEGRTIHAGNANNAIAAPLPDAMDRVEELLYVVAHEATGSVASGAIADNTTPAEQRSGVVSRYEQAAAVRAGALLLERTIPTAVPGYMRYYLLQAGRQSPNDPRAAFASAFAIPDAMRDAIARQLDVVLGGI